jgi:hypothetical protein
MGFVYGIAAFPTSIRYEDEHFLVYDDLMQTTLIHLNAIPTDTYVPDLRYLFSDPRRGLELIKRLFALAVRAAVEISSVDDFAVKFFSPAALTLMEQLGKQTFVEHKVLAGFNFPPSQWQLHLQFILPPYGPFHGVLLNEGKHTDKDRFLPFDFVKECLEVLEGKDANISLSEMETFSGKQLVECLHQRTGVDYYKNYYAAVSDVKLNDALCGNWKSEDFEFVVVDKRVVLPVSALDRGITESTEGWAQCEITPSELQKRDKQTIQSYGKGMGLQYYSFAKNPGQVGDWHTPDP